MPLSKTEKESLILLPIGGQPTTPEGAKIEPTEIPVGPTNDGGNPNLGDVSHFGMGPDCRKRGG
jgi:hypothetical protein